MRYTATTLKKLEQLFEAQDYEVRYEKGHFQSGYCLVESRKIIIINKFYDTEGRINCMLDILSKIELSLARFDEDNMTFYKQLFPATE